MPAKLGIVAGGGELPAQIVSACRESGRDYFLLALEGHALPEDLPQSADLWMRLGQAGKGIRSMRDAGVEEVVLAGRVRRPSLAEIRPDPWTAKAIAKIGWSIRGDDGILRKVIRLVESEGFRVVAPDTILTELIATEGAYGRHTPDDLALSDIERGLEVLHALGALDVGQAAVVQDGFVLGVEAAEGTDALIARCGPLRRDAPGGVLVKAAKPDQERRVDLPTIGPATVDAAIAAGLRGVAIEAGAALVVSRAELVRRADTAGLFVVGVGRAA